MPRAARQKSENAMYHIMSRSISEIDLFQSDSDKKYYLSLLKRYAEKYKCKIYAYCLMSNHVHIFINPQGFDISTFMRSLNTAYVTYFNKRYNRHGHLFQGRFASRIVDNDTYCLTLSAYIHNNAKDIPNYSGNEELYPFSSYGIYLGIRNDAMKLVDTDFLLNIFSTNKKTAQTKYHTFTRSMKDTGIIKEVNESILKAYTENEYRSEKQYVTRFSSPDKLMQKLVKVLGKRITTNLRAKYCREASNDRAFATYIMRVICGCSYKSICEYIGNMSMSGIQRLSHQGFILSSEQPKYSAALNSLIS